MKASQELFIIQQNDAVQIDIKTIKEAFEQLHKRKQELFHVFNTLIEKLLFIKMAQLISHIHLRNRKDLFYWLFKTSLYFFYLNWVFNVGKYRTFIDNIFILVNLLIRFIIKLIFWMDFTIFVLSF